MNHSFPPHVGFAQAQQPEPPRQAPISRALETQAIAGKHLHEVANLLCERLAPAMTQEPDGAGTEGSSVGPSCPLASAIDRGTSDMQQVTGLLHSILRRLAL